MGRQPRGWSRALPALASLLLGAAPAPEGAVELQGCAYAAVAEAAPGSQPTRYEVSLVRQAGPRCPHPAGRVGLGSTYGRPRLSLVAAGAQLAVAYPRRLSPGAGAHTTVEIARIWAPTLAITRRATLAARAPAGMGLGNVDGAELRAVGQALLAGGSCAGQLPGAAGHGGRYLALYAGFFGPGAASAPRVTITW